MVNLLAQAQRPVRTAPPKDDGPVDTLPPALAEALGSTPSELPRTAAAHVASSNRSTSSTSTPGQTGTPATSHSEDDANEGERGDETEGEGEEQSPEEVLASLRGLVGSLGAHERAMMAPVLRELGLDQPDADAAVAAPTQSGAAGTGNDTHFADLLTRMDAANVAADGLEAKLDRLLTSLDGLLVDGGDTDALDRPED